MVTHNNNMDVEVAVEEHETAVRAGDHINKKVGSKVHRTKNNRNEIINSLPSNHELHTPTPKRSTINFSTVFREDMM